jgi:predicted phage terminase large subunit-like protein
VVSLDDKIAFVAADIERRRRLARKHLLHFTTYTKPDYKVAQFHELVSKYLELAFERKIKRLMIFGPPQHGKSEKTSRRGPAWALGRWPHLKILGASYAGSLARSMNLDVQRIMESDRYRELFPEVQLTGLKNTEMFEIPRFGGRYRAAGVGMGITGQSADIGIIDDPIKDYAEASSQVIRDALENWYHTTFRTRIADDGVIIITLTRWHEDDLAGRLLAKAKADPKADQWTVVRFEALRETPPEKDSDNAVAYEDTRELGEPLAPFRYSKESLEATKASVGPRFWQSVYQGSPTEQKGAIIKREWCTNFYRKSELPARFQTKVTSWDLQFKEGQKNDFVSGTAWGKKDARIYLLGPHEYHERVGFSDALIGFEHFTIQHKDAHQHLVENKANGPALESVLKKKIGRIVLVEPLGGKIVRAQATEGLWSAGNIWLPHPDECPWVMEWIEEIVGFPNKAKDDRVDSMSQALCFLDGRAGGSFPTPKPGTGGGTLAGPLGRRDRY